MSDIRDLLRIYGVDGASAEELEDLAIRARARPWWRDYTDIFENEFPGFENDAERIRVFMPLVAARACCRPRTTRRRSCGSARGRRPGGAGRWRPGSAARRSWTGPTARRPGWSR